MTCGRRTLFANEQSAMLRTCTKHSADEPLSIPWPPLRDVERNPQLPAYGEGLFQPSDWKNFCPSSMALCPNHVGLSSDEQIPCRIGRANG
jgi:hypothetical protein